MTYSTKFDRGVPLRIPVMGQLTPSEWQPIKPHNRIDGCVVSFIRGGENIYGIWMENDHILYADEQTGRVVLDPFSDHDDVINGYLLPKLVVNANGNGVNHHGKNT